MHKGTIAAFAVVRMWIMHAKKVSSPVFFELWCFGEECESFRSASDRERVN